MAVLHVKKRDLVPADATPLGRRQASSHLRRRSPRPASRLTVETRGSSTNPLQEDLPGRTDAFRRDAAGRLAFEFSQGDLAAVLTWGARNAVHDWAH